MDQLPSSPCINSILPQELILQVMQNLSERDLRIISLVCCLWKRAAEDNLLWRPLVKRTWPLFRNPPESNWKAYFKENLCAERIQHIINYKGSIFGICNRAIYVWSQHYELYNQRHQGVYQLHIFPTNHARFIQCFRILRGQTPTIVTGSADATIKIWQKTPTERTLICNQTLFGHTKAITVLRTFENYLISGSADKTIRIWKRLEDNKPYECALILEGHEDTITSLAISGQCRKGFIIISGSGDGSVGVWKVNDIATVYDLERMRLHAHRNAVTSIALSTPESTLMTGSADSTIKVWNNHCAELKQTIQAHEGPVTCLLDDSYREGHLISSSTDGKIKLWKINPAKNWELASEFACSQSVEHMCFDFNFNDFEEGRGYDPNITRLGLRLYVLSGKKTIRLWVNNIDEPLKFICHQKISEEDSTSH